MTTATADRSIPAHLARLRALALPGFLCELPPEWEVTAFRLPVDAKAAGGLKEGRLHFHRHERAVAQCTWRRYAKAPDLATTMTEVARRIPGGADPAVQAPAPLPAPGGFLTVTHADGACQYARFFAADGVLLHWFFPAEALALTGPALSALLESHRDNHGSEFRWSLFGISLTVPSAFAFARLDARSAAVALELVDKKGLHLRAWRLPLAGITLASAGGPAGVLRQLLTRNGARGIGAGDQTVRGGPGARAAFARPARSGIESIFARWHPGEAWLWSDQDEGRLYAFEQWGPRKLTRLDPGCCA